MNDSISKSAPIVINLPKGVTREAAKTQIQFTPTIRGEWETIGTEAQLIYKPARPLAVGKYYSVTLASQSGTIGKDFLAADDPSVVAVFPASDSEANEKSSVTVVFNRPMVPLSTLDVLQSEHMPLTVTPATPGKYKWIGTRTVQFIPADRLQRSSNYVVKIAANLSSTDGLAVPASESNFITRPLRYQYFSTDYSSSLIYNQPISIHFNQPVNLEKTKSEIHVYNITTNSPTETIIEYGATNQYNVRTKKYDQVTDQSVINVYARQDSHGRAKLWDFTNQYNFVINKAYPQEGDINLDEPREVAVTITNIIANTAATSDRSNLTRPDFFDPYGKFVVRFYESVNLAESEIKAPELAGIEYGQKCETDAPDSEDQPCPKVPDHEVLVLRFNAHKLASHQTIPVEFQRIVNEAHYKINFDPLKLTLTTLPALSVLHTIPATMSTGTSVTNLILCTNSPLVVPKRKDVGSYFSAAPAYEFKQWSTSFYVTSASDASQECAVGEFQTNIAYGFMPQTVYKINLKLQDHFGAKAEQNLDFTTGDMPGTYLNFYHLQKEYNVTSPERTKLTYAEENMEFVDVHMCKLSAEGMLRVLANKPQYFEGPDAVSGCSETQSKRLTLPKRFWIKNYFTVDVKDYFSDPIGHYVFTFSHPDYRDQSYERRQVYERTYASVTRLGIVEKKIEVWDKMEGMEDRDKLGEANRKKLMNLYWITDLTTLNPVSGATVDRYTVSGRPPVFSNAGSLITDGQGVAKGLPLSEQDAVIVKNGPDTAFTYNQEKFGYASNAQSLSKLYVYTDRPIYRPGHEVDVKGIYRFGYDGAYEINRTHPVTLKIFDSAQKEIYSKELPVNEFGTFNATTTLDLSAPLGSYRIDVDGRGFGYFDVQEYVPAAFKVDVAADKEEYIAGDTMNLKLNAAYYFGAPVAAGTVEYSLVSQNYYFDKYQGDYFQFGRGWYECYDNCFFGDKFITRGTATLDDKGNANISQKMDLKKWFPKEADRASKIITLYLTVRNSNGQSVSTQKTIILHAGEYYLGLNTDNSFIAKNQPVTMKVKSVSTEGKETSVSGLHLTYNRVHWLYNQRQGLDGGYYYSWEKKLEAVQGTTVGTDGSGNASDTFTPTKEGEYEVSVRGTDGRDNVILSTYTIYVYGDQPVEDLRPSNDNQLDVVVKQPNVNVGDTATMLIKSPYPHAKALITVERGNVYQYEVVDINQSLYPHRFTIRPDYVPNVYASVVLLSDKPEVRYGQASFNVDTKLHNLSVTVTANKQQYLPGEEVTLNFTAKNSAGQPVAAEFSAAVVDMSVLALKGNPKKNPVMFFYDGFPLTVSTLSNVKNILYKVDIPVGGKGGGGGDADDLARRKRGEFKDTAYWNAVIRTNAQGTAQVKFRLPDNLTTWQAEAVGVTKDTIVGAGYTEFTSNKYLMAVPLKPRFILPGDKFVVGANVFNRTDKKLKLSTRFDSATLKLTEGKNTSNLSVPAGDSKTIYFNVTAPTDKIDGVHNFTISVKNKDYEDTVEQSIPIHRNDTYETAATAGYSPNPSTRESLFIPSNVVPDKGSVTVKTSATLAVFLSDALKYMLEFPYDSCEQIGSKLETVAILKRASQLKNMEAAFPVTALQWHDKKYPVDEAVRLGLNELYKRQNPDGGFLYYSGYYNQYQSNFYLSLGIGRVLAEVKAAKFDVDENRMRQLYQYIVTANERGTPWGPYDDNTEMLVAATLSNLKGYGEINQYLIGRIRNIIKDTAFLNEHSSNTALAELYLVLTDEAKIFGSGATKVLKILENRIQIDARGAYLAPNNNLMWQYYETPVKDTALYLKVATHAKHDSQVTDRLLRWLIASRAKDGSWGSTQNTLAVIDSFTDFLTLTHENESDFTVTTYLDQKQIRTMRFATSTVLSQDVFAAPLKDLPRDQLLPLELKKENHNQLTNTLYYDIALRYFLPVNVIPPRDEGFAIQRGVYRLDDKDNQHPVQSGKVGEVLKVHEEIIVPRSRNFVALEDFIPAGAEIVNTSLETEDKSVGLQQQYDANGNPIQYNYTPDPVAKTPLYGEVEEMHDDRLYKVASHLEPGTYTVDYYIRLLIPGTFQHLPAVVSENYFPENFGRTGGSIFTVEQ